MGWLKKNWLRALTHILALAPLLLLVADYVQGNLGFDPIREITFRTGTYALLTLVLSLACTPLNTIFGLRQVLPLRRPLGLYAFLYASLHFLTFIGLDYQFDIARLQVEIFERRYALVGFTALLILLPLAITSTKGWMKRLGKNWKRLHRLVYLAALLAVVHYAWVVKADLTWPLVYGAVVGGLLLVRIPAVRQPIIGLRQRLGRRKRQTQELL